MLDPFSRTLQVNERDRDVISLEKAPLLTVRKRDMAAQENYVHHAWCREIFRSPQYQHQAASALRKMGVENAETFTSDQLCERLAEMTCTVAHKDLDQCTTDLNGQEIPALRRIKLNCGGESQCWDMLELEKKLQREPTFAARMSEMQRTSFYKKLNRVKSSTVLPCHVLSGNKEACSRRADRKCALHEQSLLGALFGAQANNRFDDQECHLTAAYLRKVSTGCSELPMDELISVVDDIHYDQVQKLMVDLRRLSMYEQSLAVQEMQEMLERMNSSTRTLKKSELCTIIQEYQAEEEVKWTSSWLSLARQIDRLLKKLQVPDRYITMEQLLRLFRALDLKLSERVIFVIHRVLNLIGFYYENTVAWGTWFILFAEGRATLKKILTEPITFVAFCASFYFMGLTDPILPNIEKLQLDVDWTKATQYTTHLCKQLGITQGVMDKVVRTAGGVGFQQLNQTNVTAVYRYIGKRLRGGK